jgi:hypothetical protein
MKYKLQIEKLKQLKMESVNQYCIMKQSFRAKEILNNAELKKEDFVNEAIYNTVIGNICKLLTENDKLNDDIQDYKDTIKRIQNKVNPCTDIYKICEYKLSKI